MWAAILAIQDSTDACSIQAMRGRIGNGAGSILAGCDDGTAGLAPGQIPRGGGRQARSCFMGCHQQLFGVGMEMILPMIEMPTLDQMPVVADVQAADNTQAALAERRAALAAQLALVEAQLQAQAAAERAELIRGINETMQVHGITLADLGAHDKPVTRLAKGEPKPGALIGIKLAPKYRDQATGETWSGRGLQPKWLKARIAGGAELESFRVA